MSLFAPGSGQIYCGATKRGVLTLLAFCASIAFALFGRDAHLYAFMLPPLIYAFASVDAYFTALENNAGIEPDAPDNPRVAAIFGTKMGFGSAFIMGILWRSAGRALPLLAEVVMIVLSAYAYAGAKKERAELKLKTVQVGDVDSSIPPILVWGIAGLCVAAQFVLITIEQIKIFTS